jgi:uncharacterized membrane protein YobD (UPF0266 family)
LTNIKILFLIRWLILNFWILWNYHKIGCQQAPTKKKFTWEKKNKISLIVYWHDLAIFMVDSWSHEKEKHAWIHYKNVSGLWSYIVLVQVRMTNQSKGVSLIYSIMYDNTIIVHGNLMEACFLPISLNEFTKLCGYPKNSQKYLIDASRRQEMSSS